MTRQRTNILAVDTQQLSLEIFSASGAFFVHCSRSDCSSSPFPFVLWGVFLPCLLVPVSLLQFLSGRYSLPSRFLRGARAIPFCPTLDFVLSLFLCSSSAFRPVVISLWSTSWAKFPLSSWNWASFILTVSQEIPVFSYESWHARQCTIGSPNRRRIIQVVK